MRSCPDELELEAYARGAGSEGERESMGDHLTACVKCDGLLAQLTRNLEEERLIRSVRRSGSDSGSGSGSQSGSPPATPIEESSDSFARVTQVGPFQIVRELGRGGMGVVYLAHQTRPKRDVALKLIRPTLATADAERRFRREADLLAKLQHPGIAQVYEAGVAEIRTANGTGELAPYFAMEFVDGLPVDRYVVERGLGARQRLEILARISEAVHHAHLHGVIHRDLKPANILVADDPLQSLGQPKILDFGVARVVETTEAALTMGTAVGQIVGSIPFMSPEQVAGDPSRIDARSDVYALGVLGYLLLVGRLPYDMQELSVLEAIRTIREEPVVRLGSVDTTLRGDIEVVIGKALEKEPGDRFPTALALAEDLRRILERRPIHARPPNTLIQLRRFAERNRGLVAAVVALFVVLAAAGVIGASLAIRAGRAERAAEDRLELAERERARLGAVNDFLNRLLESPNAHFGVGRNVTVREVLDDATLQLDAGAFVNSPEVEIELRRTIGNTVWTLGDFDAAGRHFERALALVHEDAARDPALLFDLSTDLGLVRKDRCQFAQVESIFRSARDLAAKELPHDHDRLVRAHALLGGILTDRARYAEAESSLAVVLRSTESEPESPPRLSALHSLGRLRHATGDHANAIPLLETTLEGVRRAAGPHHPQVTKVLNTLGCVLLANGQIAEADSVFRQSWRMNLEIFGEEHPDVAISLHQMGLVHLERGELEEAEGFFLRALAMNEALLGPEHLHTLQNRIGRARVLAARGRSEDAWREMERAAAAERALLGETPELAETLEHLADLALRLGRVSEARSSLEQALRILRSAHGGASARERAMTQKLDVLDRASSVDRR